MAVASCRKRSWRRSSDRCRRAALALALPLLLPCPLLAGEPEGASRIPQRLEECDALVGDEPDRYESYRCYWFVARNHDRLRQAAERLESLLARASSNPHVLLTLGAIAADLGEERAEELYRAALEAYASQGDARGEVYSRVSLALALRQRGLTAEASEQLDEALARAIEAGDAGLESQVRVNLGWQKYYERQYGRAWELLATAERLVFPDGSIHEQLATLDGLAAVCWAQDRGAAALRYYRRMIALLKGNDPYRASDVRRNIAFVARDLAADGRLDDEELTRLEREALDAAIGAGNPRAEVGARLLLAESLPGREGLEQARIALVGARRIGRLSDTCWALWFVAERSLALDPEDPAAAFLAVEEAIDLARERGDPETLAQGMLVRARMRWATGPRARALAESVEALDAIERIRDLQPDGEARARVFSRFADAYRHLAHEVLLSQDASRAPDDLQAAFAFAERMRARSLLETLDAAGLVSVVASTGPLSATREEILDQMSVLRGELQRPAATPAERRPREERLRDLERREAALRRQIAQEDPGFAALRGVVVPSIDAVQAALAVDQALVSFLISERRQPGWSMRRSRSWGLVISREQAYAVPLPDSRDLRRRVRLYLSLLGRKDGSGRAGAERLFRDLLGAPLGALAPGITRLVVIPDGPLHRLPFGALIDPTSGTYLAERFTVAVAPSAATWLRWKRSSVVSPPFALLAFADPERSQDLPEIARLGLQPLPHARREADSLRRRFGGRGQVLVGADASERALKSAPLAEYRLLHFASHAVVNDDHPDRSAIVLTPDRNPVGEDGLLRFGEVASLDLQGQVVLLSACRGASGPLIGGEGVMGLASAFFQAGARTVVAGLWPVQDRETSVLVERFGEHLSRGSSVSTALALARRDLLRDGLPPAAWAGMIVLGDGDLAPFPAAVTRDGQLAPLLLVLVVLASLGLVVGWILRDRRAGEGKG